MVEDLLDIDASEKNISRLGDDKEEFLNTILKDLEESQKQLNPWKIAITKYMDLYKMVQNKKHYDGLAQIFVPEILRAVETVTANLYKIIFSQNPWFEYQGRDSSEDAAAQAHTQLVDWQMDENRFKLRVQNSLRQMVITGLTVRKVLWDFQQVKRKKKALDISSIIDPITQEKKTSKKVSIKEEVETIKDVWTFEPVDLISFHISDVGTPYDDIQKARWIMEQYIVQKDWLKTRIKRKWLREPSKEEWDELNEKAKPPTSEYLNLKENMKKSSGYHPLLNPKGVEILERWGLLEAKYVYDDEELQKHELESDDLVETVVIIANRKLILKLEANPFWHDQKPYLSCPYVPIENEFSGMGIAQIGQSLQEELNDTRNQTMDNKTLIIMNMWLKSRSSGINNKDLRVRPMGVINTNDMNGLKPLAPPVLTGVGVNIEGVIKNDLRESVGAASNLQGIAQSGVSTATESTQINNASFGRLMLTAQLYAELIIKPLLVWVEYLNYQFYDVDKVVKIVGQSGIKFKKISPDMIVGNKDVIIRLSSDLDDNPSLKRQQLIQFLTIMQQLPPQAIDFHWNLLDKVYKAFFPNGHSLEDLYKVPADHEELLTPDEEADLMINERPVKVHEGDNDQEHLKKHEQDMESYKMALSPTAFAIFQAHIMDHYKQMTAKVQAQQQQMVAQQIMMQNGGKSPQTGMSPVNPGQVANATPDTASMEPTTGGQLRTGGL